MNKEELQKRYPNGIPDSLKEGVSYFETLSQKSGIRSVRLMSNFGTDMEQSLLNNTNVYKGLIVQVTTNYELSETDRSWFHPELSKARSLYDGKRKLSDIDLGEINSLNNLGSVHYKLFLCLSQSYYSSLLIQQLHTYFYFQQV